MDDSKLCVNTEVNILHYIAVWQSSTGRKHVSHVVCYSCWCTILLVLWGRLCIIICYTQLGLMEKLADTVPDMQIIFVCYT